jgi:hypothetical protein
MHTIDRTNPASPATIVVKAGTKVTIHLTSAREKEAVTFAPTTTQAPPIDVATTLLKSAITPLQSLVINQKTFLSNKHIQTILGVPGAAPAPDPIAVRLNELIDRLDDVLGPMADASVRLSCLEAYRVIDGGKGNFTCSVILLKPGGFAAAKKDTIEALMAASRIPLPAASLQDIKKVIDAHVEDTLKLSASAVRTARLANDDLYLSTYTVLNTAITDTQKAQGTMLETAEQLTVLANSPSDVTFPITQTRGYNSSVAIVAQEVVSKTNTTVATVVINWQSNPWEIATGIMFSTLVSRSFSNAPLLVNGQPQYDSGGKNLTVVQEADTQPAIMFPLVTANYRLAALSNFHWENQCPGHCAVLLTGGIGLNLTAKTAEFLVGPSFRFGGLLLTPGWHIGRENELIQAVTVGARFGSSPPNPLPTAPSWKAKFSLGISYVLPFSRGRQLTTRFPLLTTAASSTKSK